MKEARRTRFIALLAGHYKGDRKRLIADSGLTHGRISQLLADGFGERAARELEVRLQLPHGYFDRGAAIGLSPRAQKIGELLDRLAGDEARHTAAYAILRDKLDELLAMPAAPAPEPPPPAAKSQPQTRKERRSG
jgi:hypothetical protein